MATSKHDIAVAVEAFIRRQFRIVDTNAGFSRDAHLFESGFVDSAGVVELIMFVGTTFGVDLKDEHVFSERFTTINGISDIVMTCEAECHERGAAFR
jgi:acyl carrier protein